jgi:hypothetical protein
MTLQQPQPPVLLQNALKTLPGVKLLDETSGTPWLLQDMDRDKRPDVVAVVVKTAASGPEYGVFAVHAGTPQEIHWIVDFDVDAIQGVVKGKANDTVIPLFCVDCEANLWFRWSGEDYEAQLHAVGEQIEIGSETQNDPPLYSSPNLASKPLATVPHCTTVTVRKVSGTPEKRWYFVETPEGQRGWIPDDATSSDICVG